MNTAVTLAQAEMKQDHSARRVDEMHVSIIVPVLNEALLIGNFLRHLRQRAPGAEIIVVDGGSADSTREIAADLCDQLITTDRNRAQQMNLGASFAHGDLLWFVHVDVHVPSDCLDAIATKLNDPNTVGGYFRIRLPRNRLVYRLSDDFAHYAGRLLRIRCADHGFFCWRRIFETLGGFPDLPVMEDVEFFRAMHRCGRICAIDNRLLASARRYESVGPLRLTFFYGAIATLYALRVPLRFLAWLYAVTCHRS